MRSRTLIGIVVTTMFLCLSGMAHADETAPDAPDPRQVDIMRLLEISHGLALGQQFIDQLIDVQRSSLPQVPAQVWDELRQEFDLREMTAVVVAIYERNYSADDVKGLIAFYESPLGQKLIATQPVVLKESIAAGQQWAQTVLERMARKLKERGYSS